MKTLIIALTTAVVLSLSAGAAFAGSCDNSWQTAKDGSNCGDRAADRREGGR